MLPEGSIYISGFTLHIKQTFSATNADRVILRNQLGGIEREFPVWPHKHKEEFDPPHELSPRDRLSISIQRRSQSRVYEHIPSITIEQSDIVQEARDNIHGKKTFVKESRDIAVIIDILRDPPPPAGIQSPLGVLFLTTSKIRRFRILVIGDINVGKSSLIKEVLRIRDQDSSQASCGLADINQELVARGNERLVLHDSLGLGPGECQNSEVVKDFIRNRRQKKDLQDRLHAVWACIEVPYGSGSFFGTSIEEFLRDRKEILGDIPLIVVLTKLDRLDNSLIQILRTEGVTFETIAEAQPLLWPHRTKYLKKYCTQPLLQALGSHVPHIAVSTMTDCSLESTISKLFEITIAEIMEHTEANPSCGVVSEQTLIERNALLRISDGVVPEQVPIERDAPLYIVDGVAPEQAPIERNASLYIAGMAQRASIEAKIDISIQVAKRSESLLFPCGGSKVVQEYKAILAAGFDLSADKVKENLLDMHRDILEIWNFDDPQMALQDDHFKEVFFDASDLEVHGPDSMASLVSPLASLAGSLASTIFILPVVGLVTLVWLYYKSHQSLRNAAKRFMAYITDLIYLMRILFILTPQGTVTAWDVALALRIYKGSTYKSRVHLEINDFIASLGMSPPRDVVLEKVEALVRQYDITDQEITLLRSHIRVEPGTS